MKEPEFTIFMTRTFRRFDRMERQLVMLWIGAGHAVLLLLLVIAMWLGQVTPQALGSATHRLAESELLALVALLGVSVAGAFLLSARRLYRWLFRHVLAATKMPVDD